MGSLERAMLLGIVGDMLAWPEAQDYNLRQVDLLGYSYYGNSEPKTAALLMQRENSDASIEWMLVHLANSYIHYFKRNIWFYTLITDGAAAPFQLVEGRRDPAIELSIERRPYGPYEVQARESWRLSDVG